MSVEPGTRLGPYEIVAALGAGGMGEVYRARDPRLGREVAVKVLPPEVARDADRRARFEREARAVAALSHPNILALHELGTEGEQLYVVTELLEGETLADRLRQGALPPRKAVEIAIAIARGLAAAHGKGIAHRDLKPANVFLLADGQVKILDFGLARPAAPEASGATLTQAPLTDPGTVLGTVGYMAPEQVRGQAVDGRADLFALGVVLYEMLSGARAFARDTTADTLTAVLKEEPPDLAATRADLTPALDRIVRHCLEKNPAERFQSARDVIFALEALSGSASAPVAAAASTDGRRRPRALAWAVPVVMVGALAGYAVRGRPPEPESRVTRTSLVLPPGAPITTVAYPSACLAISPSGSDVVYCAANRGDTRLYVRTLDDLTARPLDGSEGGGQPFFSPDGQSVGFFTSDGALKRVALAGGMPGTLARGLPYAAYVNASWLADGHIVFDTWNGGLRMIAADGGSIETVTAPTGEWHQFPQPLPNGRVMYTVLSDSSPRVEARPLSGGAPTVLLTNASHARYAASGHLVFVRDRSVMVAPFDAGRVLVTGDARPAGIEPTFDEPAAAAPLPQLAVSSQGTLVYVEMPEGAAQDALVATADRADTVEEIAPLPRFWALMALSPDGTRMALTGRGDGPVRTSVLDLRSRTTTVVADRNQDFPTGMVWAPDGQKMYAATFTTHESAILAYDVQGSAPPATLHRQRGTYGNIQDISRDGRTLVYGVVTTAEGATDIWTLALGDSPPTARPFLATPAREWGGALSPNGSWIAYVSSESSASDVYLQRFPGGGAKVRAAEGINAPQGLLWSADGRELFVHAEGGRAVVSIPVQWQPNPVFGKPTIVRTGPFAPSGDSGRSFALQPPGRRILLARPSANYYQSGRITVVQNWFAEVRRLTAAK